MENQKFDIFKLSDKKEPFTAEEINFLKAKYPKNNWLIKYAFYNKKSKQDRYITFIIDSMPYVPRRSALENNWEIICTRPLTDIEYDEMIQNFGCNNRRFKVWYYQVIESLIEDDNKYEIQTPAEFVQQAKQRGFSGDIQLKLNFNH